MTCSVVVSCYNHWDLVLRCIEAFMLQTRKPDAVVIADDGSAGPPDLTGYRHPFDSLLHVWHPDDGNRKPAALNRAVAHTGTDCLVFVDADCLPHPKFVEDHMDLLETHPGCYVQGSRAEVLAPFVHEFRPTFPMVFSHAIRGRITSRIKAFRFPGFLRKHVWGGPFYPCGSNISCRRSDYVAIDGYDEQFSGSYNEDRDFCYRLQASGVMPVQASGCCILFHLGHGDRGHSDDNATRLEEKLRSGNFAPTIGFTGTCDRPPPPTVRSVPPSV